MQEQLAGVMGDYSELDPFWQRFNKVMLEKLALEKDRTQLQVEHQQLRALLKQYLDGISVNEEVVAHLNPLFVVNFKTNVKYVIDHTTPLCYSLFLSEKLGNLEV